MNHRKRQLTEQYGDLARVTFESEPLVFVSINLDLTAMRRAVQRDQLLVLADELLTALRYTKREDAMGVFYRKLLHRVSRAVLRIGSPTLWKAVEVPWRAGELGQVLQPL